MTSVNTQTVQTDQPQHAETADVTSRQEPIRQRYREAPDEAWVVDYASTVGGTGLDAFHGRLDLGRSTGGPAGAMVDGYVAPETGEYNMELPVGIHRAIGGDHDVPNPGNLLSAALATCLDTTIRMIADRMGIALESLRVKVASHVDVRGTLRVEEDVPVGFRKMECHVRLRAADGTDAGSIRKLLRAAEYSSVNLRTLQAGVPVELHYDIG